MVVDDGDAAKIDLTEFKIAVNSATSLGDVEMAQASIIDREGAGGQVDPIEESAEVHSDGGVSGGEQGAGFEDPAVEGVERLCGDGVAGRDAMGGKACCEPHSEALGE